MTPLLPWPRVWLHFSILVWPPPPPSMASPSHQNLLTSHCRSSSFSPIVTNSKSAYLGLRIVSLCCSFWPAPNLTLVCRAPYYDPKARGVTWSKDHLSHPSPPHLLTHSFPLQEITIDEADYDQNQSADNLVLVSLTIGKEQKGDDQRWPLIDSSLDLLASKSAHYVLKQSIG